MEEFERQELMEAGTRVVEIREATAPAERLDEDSAYVIAERALRRLLQKYCRGYDVDSQA